MNYCSSCGNQVEGGNRFCGNCGQNLNFNQNTVKAETPLHKMNHFIKKNPIIAIIVAITVTAIIVMAIKDTPAKSADKTLKHHQKHAIEAAESMLEQRIKLHGFSFVKVKKMEATLTEEETINLQPSGNFFIKGIVQLKDKQGKKHDVEYSLDVDFRENRYKPYDLNIWYEYPLIDQVK
ncbi:zinc ribbon domain-containing protein [Lederbergia graminis]